MDQRPSAPQAQVYRAARRESYHTGWDRPRPSLTGLAAGSVVTLEVAGPVTATALAGLERDGVGERTAEGFGQIRFGGQEVAAATPLLTPAAAAALSGQADIAGALPPAPHLLERIAVADEISRRVALQVIDGPGIDAVIPGASQVESRAQWGTLRELLPRLGTESGQAAAAQWLTKTGEVRRRRDTWGQPALDALTRLLTDRAKVWAVLSLDGTGLDDFALAPDRAAAIRAALWPDAVRMLITQIGRTVTRGRQSGQDTEEQR